MERVCYVLGAGFSAPLGLPVSSNFISRSRDLFAERPDLYRWFPAVYRRLRELAVIKNTYSADLSNIEEVLSLIEMDVAVKGSAFGSDFVRFLRAVIAACTPSQHVPEDLPDEQWLTAFFGGAPWMPYGAFVASMFGLRVTPQLQETSQVRVERVDHSECEYSVVTLNYDLVLENVADTLGRRWGAPGRLVRPGDLGLRGTSLAKLHGCAGDGTIIAPTWNKSLRESIAPEWRAARRDLASANYIRVLGYSLPATDSYVRYLFKSAAVESNHLKQFDVLCLDPHGDVQRRYDEFVGPFPNYRFVDGRVDDYLEQVLGLSVEFGTHARVFDGLEDAHRKVFDA